MQLQIEQENAIKAYDKADAAGKKLLVDLLGENNIVLKITDRVRSFEDACRITGDSPGNDKFIEGTPDDIAYQKLKVICKALNGSDWKADYQNGKQQKWEPFFTKNPSGSGLVFYLASLCYSPAYVGSRLCFRSRELCEYATKQFLPLYNDLLN
jgi:hypothetical protein